MSARPTLFSALKPGGVAAVQNHTCGHGVQRIHRIDLKAVRAPSSKADSRSRRRTMPANLQNDHNKLVFDPSIGKGRNSSSTSSASRAETLPLRYASPHSFCSRRRRAVQERSCARPGLRAEDAARQLERGWLATFPVKKDSRKNFPSPSCHMRALYFALVTGNQGGAYPHAHNGSRPDELREAGQPLGRGWGGRCLLAAWRPPLPPQPILTNRSMRFPPRTDQASRQHRRRETAA